MIPLPTPPKLSIRVTIPNGEGNCGIFDVRLSLKGKNGGKSLILELGSEVLAGNSSVFADLIADQRRNSLSSGFCRIEVPDVENLGVFRETIELMFEDDIQKKLLKISVFRAIDILEINKGSAAPKFDASGCVARILAENRKIINERKVHNGWEVSGIVSADEKLNDLKSGLQIVKDSSASDIRILAENMRIRHQGKDYDFPVAVSSGCQEFKNGLRKG